MKFFSSHKGKQDDPTDEDRKYYRIWRLEASREFIFFMAVIIFAIATSMYNPLKLQEIAVQNQGYNLQSLNNTDRIIQYLDISNKNDTAKGMDIIKVLFLYAQDHERDLAKLMDAHNLNNTHFVTVNTTHAITENGTIKLPYPIDLAGFIPKNNTLEGGEAQAAEQARQQLLK